MSSRTPCVKRSSVFTVKCAHGRRGDCVVFSNGNVGGKRFQETSGRKTRPGASGLTMMYRDRIRLPGGTCRQSIKKKKNLIEKPAVK